MTTTATTNPARASARDTAPESRDTGDDARWARPAALAGIAFVVLNVAGSFAPGAPPASNASAAKITTYFRDHSGAIKAQLLLGGIGIAALMWWFGALWRIMSRAEGERPRLATVAGVGLASGLTLALVSGAINATAALRIDSAETARFLYSFSLVTIAAGGFGLAVFLIAASLLAYRTEFVPRWTSYVGGAAALAFLVGGLGTVSDGTAVNTIAFVAFFIWCVWIVAISAYMWRTPAQPR